MSDINRFTLDNGLRVVHLKDETTRFAFVNILYGVGSSNEYPDKTGIAHLFEHLMFSGSKNVSDYDGALQAAGGESNAWTTHDFTNFYETIPVQNLDTALWCESDRMSFLNVGEKNLRVQKGVVIEEFRQRCLNKPYGDLQHIICKNLFPDNSYGWPVIGKNVEQIEAFTLDDAIDFYRRFYQPSNAVLTIIANIDAEVCRKKVERWFGSLPDYPFEKIDVYPAPNKVVPAVVEEKRDVPANMLAMCYHNVGITSPLYPARDIITDILATGQSSRFYRRIVSKGEGFSRLDASVWDSLKPGLLIINGLLSPGVTYNQGEEIVTRQLEELSMESVSDHELKKCINKYCSRTLFETLNRPELAFRLSLYEMIDTALALYDEQSRYQALTPDDIRDQAALVFDSSNRTIVRYGTF